MGPAKKPASPLGEGALTVLLKERFCAPEYAFMPQVRNGTGYTRARTRTADAVAMSLWPSRGLELHGFEMKSSRADWMNEKANPAKAEDIGKFCDRWWLVVGAENIVQPGELPPTWGLLVPRKGKLGVAVEAPKLEAQPLDRSQLAAILRKAAECVVPKSELDEKVALKIQAAEARAEADLERRVQTQTQYLQREVQQLRESIALFERTSGVTINRWANGDVGRAVKFITDGGMDVLRSDLERARDRARGIATALDEQLALTPPTKTEAA